MLKAAAVLLPVVLMISGPAAGQSSPAAVGRPVAAPPAGASLQDQISALREQIAGQQKQLDELRQKLEELAQQETAPAPAPTHPQADASALPPETPATARAVPRQKEDLLAGDGKPFSPLSFRIGGAEFTPGGFADVISVFRTTNANGIGTSFGSIPFNNTPAGQLSEFRISGQNSRLTLKTQAKRGKELVTAYLEADFLGNAPPNLFVTSNSNTLRMRLYWFNLQRSKFELLGGQSWSLLTPNRTGISPMPADIFFSQVVDTNYQVGLTWARQAQIRAVYHASKNWTAAVSIENPQQYTNSATTPSFYSSQLDNGSNSAAPNLRPDVIAKLAWDSHSEIHPVHIEAAGLWSSFRTVRPDGAYSHIQGGGGSVNAFLGLTKTFRLIATTFYSSGGGRYIFGLGPDFIIRPNGALSPVHSMSGIGGFEYQATPDTLLYGYYGAAYFRRNFSVDASGAGTGFGFPGSPNTMNRSVQEPTFGYVRTFWRSPNYGALLLNVQYSYLTRVPWAPSPGIQNAHSHMIFTDFRYVLP
jgi:hypothetical protein